MQVPAVTYTVKELLANKVAVYAVGWRVKRRHCGLKLRTVARMLDYSEKTLTEIELGRRPCPEHVSRALDELYSRWWDTCAQQRDLEKSLRNMMADGSCIDLRTGSARRGRRRTRPLPA